MSIFNGLNLTKPTMIEKLKNQTQKLLKQKQQLNYVIKMCCVWNSKIIIYERTKSKRITQSLINMVLSVKYYQDFGKIKGGLRK